MTVEEFKNKYPQYSNLEGDELWNKVEDIVIEESKTNGGRWVPAWELGEENSEGKITSVNDEVITIHMRTPKFWINVDTKEIKPNEEIMSVYTPSEPYKSYGIIMPTEKIKL